MKKENIQKVVYGHVINYLNAPSQVGAEQAFEDFKLGAIVIDNNGRIIWLGDRKNLPNAYCGFPIDDYDNCFLMAGFIDTHIHYPQYRMLAAPGADLMDWLTRFTFKEEAKYANMDHATDAAQCFLDFLSAHGTTSAMAYSSVHKGACEALFEAAQSRGMALIAGKAMMDRNAPNNVLDTVEQSANDTQELINRWHANGRLRYAITPRFAVTSSEEQLAIAGELYKENSGCYLQTHLSESLGEIAYVKKLFPWAKDYVGVYDHYRLLGQKSFFGHGVHLSERECDALSRSGSTVVHCPTSNIFLGSGLADIAQLNNKKRPVKTALATDIGGGTSYSMLSTIGEAYKVATMKGTPFTAHDGFYMATLGNARTLGLEDEIGSLSTGSFADIVVLDHSATPLLKARQELSQSLEDMLFALAILGDDRAVKATYIAGNCQHSR